MLKLSWVVLAFTLGLLTSIMTGKAHRVPGTAGCGMDPNGILCEDGRSVTSIPGR